MTSPMTQRGVIQPLAFSCWHRCSALARQPLGLQRFRQRYDKQLTVRAGFIQRLHADGGGHRFIIQRQLPLVVDPIILALLTLHRILQHHLHAKVIVIDDRQRFAVDQRQPFGLLLLPAQWAQIHHPRFRCQHG